MNGHNAAGIGGKAQTGIGFVWAIGGVALATACFWLVRAYLDKGQASLLYLPIVIVCAVRFGFGPAVLGAVLSFLCWDFFFLPPFGTFVVADPKDWISLFVFLLAAVTTAQLASHASAQTRQAQAREAEIATLFEASEAISREVRADGLLAALARQLQALCRASLCFVFRRAPDGRLLHPLPPAEPVPDAIMRIAETVGQHNQAVGLGLRPHLWAKAVAQDQMTDGHADGPLGVYLPLHSEGRTVGVLHVGPRTDGLAFSAMDERLILTLANHAAVVIAREDLAERAAQAEALREADALKDSLLSLVSHELRTPLAAIKASATGLLDPRAVWDEPARMETLQSIDRETDRLSGVVGNLLDLSRLEAGAWIPCKDWCDLAEVIGTALDRLPEAQAAWVKITLADDLPLLLADYTQLALVLTNLLENAVKYTPPESPIHLSAGLSPGGVTLSVRDFGKGLTPGEEERLFERFYRGRSHRDGAVHGTGLGLALCQAIIQAHGGRLWASNAPADEPPGAVFSVFLPTDAS